jgi:hypothetical protein
VTSSTAATLEPGKRFTTCSNAMLVMLMLFATDHFPGIVSI